MASIVYYAGIHSSARNTNGHKVEKLCDALNLKDVVKEGEPCGVKLHFGEEGNDTHLNPQLVRHAVEKIREAGANPFLTDTNTLYSGMRNNSVNHLKIAYRHGFAPVVVDCPVIIADGLFGEYGVPVQIGRKHFDTVQIAGVIHKVPALVVLSHFKAHEMAGFGGAIKNLAMGGACRNGKQDQHGTKVSVDHEKCVGCGSCVKVCPQHALSLVDKKSVVDKSKCIGCFECMTVCPTHAIEIDWESEMVPFIERMTEYAYGVVKDREKNICYINFLMNITPDCDCAGWSDAPLVANLGILASHDPVAIDQASYDLVNKAEALDPKLAGVPDKFRALRPNTRGDVQLSYGEEIGLGSREYELKHI